MKYSKLKRLLKEDNVQMIIIKESMM